MTREFPDELLSALLDGELSDTERITIERHLAASPSDRQLFEDLKSLRGELSSLPRKTVSPDFADRVVRAALAEAEKQNEARGVVSRAPPVVRHFWRRWKLGAAAASAAALAACFLLAMLAGRRTEVPQPPGAVAVTAVEPEKALAAVAALPEQLLNALATSAPGGQDAVVLRLRVAKDVPVGQALDAALLKAGIGALAADTPASAALIQEAYRRSLGSEPAATTAADVIFIEAPLKHVQDALAELASAVKDPLQLEASGKLALRRGGNDDVAEGEGTAGPAKAFAHHLSGSVFPLPSKSTQPQVPAPLATLHPEQPIRLLILLDVQ